MGFFKCQGMVVKLMVYTEESKQNAHECWKQTFSNMQNQQLFQKESFSFQVWQDFSSSNPTEISLRFRATYVSNCAEKFIQQNFFPSYWPKLWNKSFSLFDFFSCKQFKYLREINWTRKEYFNENLINRSVWMKNLCVSIFETEKLRLYSLNYQALETLRVRRSPVESPILLWGNLPYGPIS